mmetsp:Transcript_25684/g.82959  ORF Transcript_25684/g.82959 Transcript_25684/m.82959 type:complete len:306 (+) Transcript_25684:1061-1978(+)
MGGQGTGAAPAPACRSAASAGALTGCQPSRHGSPRIRSAEVQHATRKASGGEGEAGGPEGGVRPAQVAAPAETTQRVGLCSLRGCHRSGAGLWRRVWAAQAGAAKASAGSRIIGGQADGIGYGTAARTDGSLGLAQAAQRDHAASESQAERASESEPLARLDRRPQAVARGRTGCGGQRRRGGPGGGGGRRCRYSRHRRLGRAPLVGVCDRLGRGLLPVFRVVLQREENLGFVEVLLVLVVAVHHVPQGRVVAVGGQPARDAAIGRAVVLEEAPCVLPDEAVALLAPRLALRPFRCRLQPVHGLL